MPLPSRCCHKAGTVTKPSKGHSIIHSDQLVHGDEDHGKTSELVTSEHGPYWVPY